MKIEINDHLIEKMKIALAHYQLPKNKRYIAKHLNTLIKEHVREFERVNNLSLDLEKNR
jgi:cation transport regulator ChaC